MAIKDQFTSEEWAGVLQAPMLAGLAVTAADPGGLWGALKESSAMAGALSKAKKDGAQGTLLSDLVAAFETSEGRSLMQDGVKELFKGKKPAEATEAAVARLGEIATVVSQKAPGEAVSFKAWLREIAEKVAESGTEGGFLGFGGVKVSDAEKKTLADIDRALGA